MKILIVEDDPDLREIMSDQFLDKNWTAFEASNGQMAYGFSKQKSLIWF